MGRRGKRAELEKEENWKNRRTKKRGRIKKREKGKNKIRASSVQCLLPALAAPGRPRLCPGPRF